MGKRLAQQARGRGTPRYLAPSFRYVGKIKLRPITEKLIKGKITELIVCQGHDAPLIKIKYEDGKESLITAPEKIKVGDELTAGNGSEIKPGNVLPLKEIPEGEPIYNLELIPGDGGKICRSTGTASKIITKTEQYAIIKLPSKKEKTFNLNCRAVIGTVAASGKTEKPFLKAGLKHYLFKAKNKKYHVASACKQNAVDHPFGNKRSSRKAKQKPVGKHASPGRKVGKLWPKRTGLRK